MARRRAEGARARPAHRQPWIVGADGLTVTVRLTPRAVRDSLDGVADGALRIRVAAPPVDGAANAALIAFVARLAGLARRDVRLTGGATGRIKQLHLATAEPGRVAERLQALVASAEPGAGPG